MCVGACVSGCYMWTLETCCFYFSCVYFPLPSSSSFSPVPSLLLKPCNWWVCSLSHCTDEKVGPPPCEGSPSDQATRQSLRFHQISIYGFICPSETGGWNLCHWLRGRWREAEEDSSRSDLWFPLLNTEEGGDKLDVAVCECAHKHIKWPLLEWGFLWIFQQPLSHTKSISRCRYHLQQG